MQELNEELLDAWVRLLLAISSERVVSDIPYNEALICNLLYRHNRRNPEEKLTATALCAETKMQKSQMNRTLNSMESRNLIIRERSASDKRQIYVTLDMTQADLYKRQHAKILNLVDTIVDKFGEEKAMEALQMFNDIADVAREVMK